MKSPVNIFFCLVLVFGSSQLYAQEFEPQQATQPELPEATIKQSDVAQDIQASLSAPNEAGGSPAPGCWSDYLRQIYKQDTNVNEAHMFANLETEE